MWPIFFVLYYHAYGHGLTRKQREVLAVQRRNQALFAGIKLGQGKDIEIESVLQISVRHLHLFVVAIEKRNGGVSAWPAMRGNLMVLRVVVGGGHAGHVAGLAAGVHVLLVERQRRLPGP